MGERIGCLGACRRVEKRREQEPEDRYPDWLKYPDWFKYPD
jgi:hypothetical protein